LALKEPQVNAEASEIEILLNQESACEQILTPRYLGGCFPKSFLPENFTHPRAQIA
jgi:hypothetical protein